MKEKKNSENETHYLPIFMCLGISVGTALGTAMDNLSTWMCMGIALGVAIGAALDQMKKNKKSEEDDQES